MCLISVNEAAARLGLSPVTVRRLISRGELSCVRPTGRTVRIPEEAVEALARCRMASSVPTHAPVAQ